MSIFEMVEKVLSDMPLEVLHNTLKETNELISLNQTMMPFVTMAEMERYRDMTYKELHKRKFRWCLQEIYLGKSADSIPTETSFDDEDNVQVQANSSLDNTNNVVDPSPNSEHLSSDDDMPLDNSDENNNVFEVEPIGTRSSDDSIDSDNHENTNESPQSQACIQNVTIEGPSNTTESSIEVIEEDIAYLLEIDVNFFDDDNGDDDDNNYNNANNYQVVA
ncbi:uncharacterized protein LOC143197359 [Rhynchophorus ferrugineus]|uniref:uncharacterized protein LOC143197359 n=1 Tax=Rhynchophorus ferrugineus TaxID=354439 RepID=UPI003FCD8429